MKYKYFDMGYLILARGPDFTLITKKERTCYQVDFVIPANYKVKIKESKKLDKYILSES